MSNEYVNHVVINGVTKLDLRSDTATAADVVSGKTFHLASGAAATGTYVEPSGSISISENGTFDVTGYASAVVNVASSGGLDLLGSFSIGEVSTTSTSAVNLNKTITVSDCYDYDLLVFLTYGADTSTNNKLIATYRTLMQVGTSAIETKNGATFATLCPIVMRNSSGTVISQSSTTAYGVYPNTVTRSGADLAIGFYARYNSTRTGTIYDTFTCDVYGVNLYDLIGG